MIFNFNFNNDQTIFFNYYQQPEIRTANTRRISIRSPCWLPRVYLSIMASKNVVWITR